MTIRGLVSCSSISGGSVGLAPSTFFSGRVSGLAPVPVRSHRVMTSQMLIDWRGTTHHLTPRGNVRRPLVRVRSNQSTSVLFSAALWTDTDYRELSIPVKNPCRARNGNSWQFNVTVPPFLERKNLDHAVSFEFVPVASVCLMGRLRQNSPAVNSRRNLLISLTLQPFSS
jgi:hypothetical protein